jgi:thioredoxin-dependent peroxiredoxin
LRDNFQAFEHQGAKIIGVNYDSPKTHKAFQNKYHLPFILLTDKDKEVAEKYGAKKILIPIPSRMTYVIDPQGIICSKP